MNTLFSFLALITDLGILYYVRMEYVESKELNMKLNKVYKAKKKKLNATQLVKAVVAQEVPSDRV
jgi:hypothetical protein